jgi:hypothetical protein
MNALAQLAKLAGEEPMPEGYAGDCAECGRGRYRKWFAEEGQKRGWVYAATETLCFTCHKRKKRVSALNQLMSIAEPDGSAEGFGGHCSSCGIGMYRRGCKELAEGNGWALEAVKGTCTTCYKREYRRKLGQSPRPFGRPQCSKCHKAMRGKRDKSGVGKVRQSATLCSACYQDSRLDLLLASCQFTHCSICARRIGSQGAHGGLVRPGSAGSETCRSCQAKENQIGRRVARSKLPDRGTGRAHSYTFGKFR